MKKKQITQEVAFKKATPPDGGEGARLRYFAHEGKLCESLPFKSFDNAPRRTKRQKGHCMELQGGALFWFSPKFTRQKFSNRENFFPACPIFANKIFSLFKRKNRQKGLRPARPKACKVGQSILTDEPADKIFSNRKKIVISRLLAPKP